MLMARITEKYYETRTKAIVCDRCKAQIFAGTPDFDAVTAIKHHSGYSSVWEDGTLIEADICEPCLKELIGSFCVISKGDELTDNWDSFFNNRKTSHDFMPDRADQPILNSDESHHENLKPGEGSETSNDLEAKHGRDTP